MILVGPPFLHHRAANPCLIRLASSVMLNSSQEARRLSKHELVTKADDLILGSWLHVIESFLPSQADRDLSGPVTSPASNNSSCNCTSQTVSEHQNERTAPRFAFWADAALTHLSLYPTPIREHKQVSGARKEAGWTGRQCIQPRKSSCKSSCSSYQWYVRRLKRATNSPANLLNRPLAKTRALVRTSPQVRSPFLCQDTNNGQRRYTMLDTRFNQRLELME